ncbi:MAG: TolC family protein [Desulfobulbaceae bacterium]|nr:MAG: TolC family protein [Desulfobulbaceae bacterium]
MNAKLIGVTTVLLLTTFFTNLNAEIVLESLSVLDLETAQKKAMEENPTLTASADRVAQATERVRQAQSLYYPGLDLTGGATWTRVSDASTKTQGQRVSIEKNQERYRLGLEASWLIFDGFSRRFNKLIAENSEQESMQARYDGQRLLLQLVAETYYNAHLALYTRQIAEADIAFNLRQLGDAELRYQQGAGSLSSVLNFKVQINRAKTDLLIAERDYEVIRFSLATLMGVSEAQLPDSLALAKLEMIEASDFLAFEPELLISKAMVTRPDLLQQHYRMKSRDAAIEQARSKYYPTLRLRGSVDGDRSDDPGFESEDFGTTIGLSLNYNLYSGGADRARIAESEAQQREALNNFHNQQNNVKKEVREAYSNLLLAQEQLKLQRSTTELVTKTRDLVRDGYNAGQESLVRLNEAQRDLVRTQSNLALSLVGLYNSRHRLLTVTGESLQKFQKK